MFPSGVGCSLSSMNSEKSCVSMSAVMNALSPARSESAKAAFWKVPPVRRRLPLACSSDAAEAEKGVKERCAR